MMRGAVAIILAIAATAATNSLEVHVTVPPELTQMARDVLKGTPPRQAPILVLEGVEIGADEGLSIRVLGPPDRDGIRQLLGVTSTVGDQQTELKTPLQKMNFAVPLNDKAWSAIASGKMLNLVLEVRNNPGRRALKAEQVYFAKPE